MIAKNLECQKQQKLSKLIEDNLHLGYAAIQKIIRRKDVKVNDKRVSKDIIVLSGDVVKIFYNDAPLKILFEDKDVLVVFKPRQIETISDDELDLKTKLENQISSEVFAVHRLDRNTSGLVIFAKNLKAKKSLDDAIKSRQIEKFYLAKVVGVPQKNEDKLTAYLKKDNKKSLVYISDVVQDGYELIKTNYKLIKNDEQFSILEINLITGKTHQIRAHLSHIGYPILGDDKYGNSEINKIQGKKFQCLTAYKLKFHFERDDYLFSLNDRSVELNQDDIDFLKSHK